MRPDGSAKDLRRFGPESRGPADERLSSRLSSNPEDDSPTESGGERAAECSTARAVPRGSTGTPAIPPLRERLERLAKWAHKRERRRWRFPERVRLCESGRVRARWRDRLTQEEFETPLRCRSFRCRRCGHRRGLDDAADIRAVLDAWGREGLHAAFAVLTFPRKRFRGGLAGRMQCWETLPRAWNRLRHRLRRRGLLGPYFTVMEAHRDGWPHVNLVIAGPIGALVAAGRWREVRRVMVREAKASGFGFEVWVSQRVAGKQLAGYLSKYLTKPEQVPAQGPRGLHRVRLSRSAFLALDTRREDSRRREDSGRAVGRFALVALVRGAT